MAEEKHRHKHHHEEDEPEELEPAEQHSPDPGVTTESSSQPPAVDPDPPE